MTLDDTSVGNGLDTRCDQVVITILPWVTIKGKSEFVLLPKNH